MWFLLSFQRAIKLRYKQGVRTLCLLLVAGHCVAGVPSDEDLQAAEALNKEWGSTPSQIRSLTRLVKTYACWQSGIDILTGHPGRDVGLHPDIRNRLITQEDIECFREEATVELPVYSQETESSCHTGLFESEYWHAATGLSDEVKSSDCLAFNLSSAYCRNEPDFDLESVPDVTRFVLLHNGAARGRSVQGSTEKVKRGETVLFSRSDDGWTAHRSVQAWRKVQVNPQLRTDWQLFTCEDSALPDKTSGEFHLPFRYLESKAKEYDAEFCHNEEEIKLLIKRIHGQNKHIYSVLMRSKTGTHSYMLRVHYKREKKEVFCFVGETLGSKHSGTKARVKTINSVLSDCYKNCNIIICYPKYAIQADFSSCHVFALAFLEAAQSGELDFMTGYFQEQLLENTLKKNEYPTWLMPVAVQRMLQTCDADYFKSHPEDDPRDRAGYDAFVKYCCASQCSSKAELPVMESKVKLKVRRRYEHVEEDYNVEAMIRRYMYLLEFIQSARKTLIPLAELSLDNTESAVGFKRKAEDYVSLGFKSKCLKSSDTQTDTLSDTAADLSVFSNVDESFYEGRDASLSSDSGLGGEIMEVQHTGSGSESPFGGAAITMGLMILDDTSQNFGLLNVIAMDHSYPTRFYWQKIQNLSERDRKESHNLTEKRRRGGISCLLQELQSALPYVEESAQLTKAATFMRAFLYLYPDIKCLQGDRRGLVELPSVAGSDNKLPKSKNTTKEAHNKVETKRRASCAYWINCLRSEFLKAEGSEASYMITEKKVLTIAIEKVKQKSKGCFPMEASRQDFHVTDMEPVRPDPDSDPDSDPDPMWAAFDHAPGEG